jgi:hypothetical protein
MTQVNEKLKKSCENALVALQKLNDKKYSDLQSKLEWCLGSYEHDSNPEGLQEYGTKSLQILKKVKSSHPRKVTKKVIDGLESALNSASKN